ASSSQPAAAPLWVLVSRYHTLSASSPIMVGELHTGVVCNANAVPARFRCSSVPDDATRTPLRVPATVGEYWPVWIGAPISVPRWGSIRISWAAVVPIVWSIHSEPSPLSRSPLSGNVAAIRPTGAGAGAAVDLGFPVSALPPLSAMPPVFALPPLF